MAKQVQDIFVRLGVENGEAITALRSSFRELGKVVTPVSANLDDLRQKVLDFGQTNARSEQLIKGQIDALKGLQAQASLTGDLYETLNKDIAQFQSELRGSTVDIDRQREALLQNAKAAEGNKAALSEVVRALQVLQQQVRSGSVTYNQFNTDINKLNTQISETATVAKVSKTAVTQFLGVQPDVVLRQWQQYTAVLKDASATAEQLALAQSRLDKLSGVSFIERINALRARTEIINDPDYQSRFGAAARSIPDLPNVTEAYNETLSRLRDNLKLTEIGSREYLNTLIEISNTQRLLTQSTQGLAEALVRNLRAGTTPTTVNTLSEALSQLRLELNNVDQSTAEGSAQFRQYNSDITQLQQQLNRLSSSYRNVADAAIDAAAAQRTTAQTRNLTNLYLRNAETLGTAQTPIVPSTQFAEPIGPRLPPAQEVSVRQQAEAQLKQAQDRMLQLMQQYQIDRVELQNKYNRISLEADEVLWQEQIKIQNEGIEQGTKQWNAKLEEADRERAKKRKGFTGLGAAQTAGAVISGGIFGGPEGLLGGLAGAAGGFLAGGGPAALGGAFAGAAIGAQLGAFRQALGGATEYAAQIDKLRLALKGIVGDEESYRQALSASFAVTRDLNVPQEVAIQNLTRLSAAVLGAGGTVNDSSFAFRALTEAVTATGGSAEQVDGAVLALTQIFSKGKVSAEELNQIAERLPGTFTLFAKAAGKTGPELQKALQEGQVGLNDLAKFLEELSKRYGKSALNIAGSSQQAGARLQVTFSNLRKAIGDALQPLGAELQSAFERFLKDIGPGIITTVGLIGKGIQGLFRIFSGGIDIVKSLSGAIKVLSTVLITLAGAQAGAFAVSNIALFTSGIKNLISFTRQLVNLQRIALAIETARASLQAIITGLSTGAMRGKLAGAIIGGGLAAGAAIFGIPKLLEYVNSQVSASIDKATRGFTGAPTALPTEMQGQYATPSSDAAQKAREDAAKKALADARALADQRQQIDKSLAKNQIELDRMVSDARIKLRKKEAELEGNLIDLLAEARMTQLGPEAKEAFAAYTEYAKNIRDLEAQVREAGTEVGIALRNFEYAKQFRAVAENAPAVTGTGFSTGTSAPVLRNLPNTGISANSPLYPIGQTVGLSAPTSVANYEITGRQRGQGVSQITQYIEQANNVQEAITKIADAQENFNLVLSFGITSLSPLSVLYNDKLTKSYTEQTTQLNKATAADKARLDLQRQGLDPAVIDYYMKVAEVALDLQQRIKGLRETEASEEKLTEGIDNLTRSATANVKALRDQAQAAYDLANAAKYLQDTNLGRGFQDGINQYIESIGTLKTATADLTATGIKGLEESLTSLVTTGTANFKEFAVNIIQETTRIIIRQLILRTILQSLFPNKPTEFPDLSKTFAVAPSAYGNVFATNGIQPFAMGGIVTKPTLFRYANGGVPGTGLMGEAGPEAIIPLQRGPNGRLGVAGGGGTYNVTVNVEAGGATTQTQGDPGQGAQLGRLIAGAVQAELIKQQRPGGLLAQR